MDAGSGCGVLGICAAGALLDVVKEAGLPSTGSGVHVRTQDRDELARVFTKYNACQNNIPADILEACTEPLLAGGEPRAEVPGPDGAHWDLTLTNIPAKAGRPVLEDFVRRSAALLNPGGRVFMVAVNTLADFFREQINAAGAELLHEEQGAEHTVFVYGCTTAQVTLSAIQTGPGFLSRYPFYLRNSDSYEIENISCPIDAVYGCGDFDSPGDDVLGAAKLCSRIGKNIVSGPWLVHEPCQGHFAVWLTKFMGEKAAVSKLVLSGRNILALEASQHNLASHLARLNSEEQQIIPASDLLCDREALLKAGPYSFIAAFPEIVPQANRHAASWEALETLLTPGGVFLISLSSADAERFDRLKPKGFSRLGDIKRKGFRALAYGK
ncbi:hypothetical protein FACS189447_04930 [Spirochaetia bacterium]|nr:hypothetical protein FACS189447_04930 [Spirochaetia bacterium]